MFIHHIQDLEPVRPAPVICPVELGVRRQAQQGGADQTEDGNAALVDVRVGGQNELDFAGLALSLIHI